MKNSPHETKNEETENNYKNKVWARNAPTVDSGRENQKVIIKKQSIIDGIKSLEWKLSNGGIQISNFK